MGPLYAVVNEDLFQQLERISCVSRRLREEVVIKTILILENIHHTCTCEEYGLIPSHILKYVDLIFDSRYFRALNLMGDISGNHFEQIRFDQDQQNISTHH